HDERKRRLLSLGDQRNPAGRVETRECAERRAIDDNRAALRREPPKQGADERALSAPVRSDDGRDRPARRVERHAVHGGPRGARVSQHDVVEADHVILRSRMRKNGTPISAVTAPRGSSAGERTVRATTSAATTSAPPATAAPSITPRAVRAPSARTMAGTTSPTNPTSPAPATVTAASKLAARYTRRVARSTSTPSAAAGSSPSASSSISRPSAIRSAPPHATYTATQRAPCHVASPSEPIIHRRAPLTV